MVEHRKLLLEYNLQFFAQDGPGGEKTEPASQKKLDDARKEGKVARSKELVSSFSLLGAFLILKLYVGTLGKRFTVAFETVYKVIPDVVKDSYLGFNANTVMSAMMYSILEIIITLLPIFAVALVLGIVTNIMQVKWQITPKAMEPKLDKINPLNGFKRIFSSTTIVELIKNIAMIAVIVYVAYTTIKDKAGMLFMFYEMSLLQSIEVIGDLVVDMGIKISVIFLVIGFADWFYQKFKFNKDMMMTKQEVKEEYKMTEGDPQIKGKRKQKMLEASRRRMMNDLPKADVVITNPTHFAVALQYDTNIAQAPVVIAKGADYLAQQIKEKAKEYNIEMVENRPLARALYNNVDVGQEIPQELYQAVAEILAVIYSAKDNVNAR